MNKIMKLTLVLFLVCAVTAGILGAVNNLTKDRIADINRQKEEAAFAVVLDADGYSAVNFDATDFPAVKEIYEADSGKGWVVKSSFSGAQGIITMVTGVSPDYECTGISIISHSETSGLGANAASSSEIGQNFRAQFIGQNNSIALAKSGGEIDALTGATITSKSVTNAVRQSILACESLG